MDTFLIVIIVLFVVLLLTGGGVGIYFLMRKKDEKASSDKSNNSGMIYSNPAIPGSVWQAQSGLLQNAQNLWLNPPAPGSSCENYLFRLGTATTLNGTFDNALLAGTTGNNVVVGTGSYSQLATVTDVSNWDQNHYGTGAFTWTRDEDQKTWCMSANPGWCLTTDGSTNKAFKLWVDKLPANFASLPPTDPVKQSFQWIGQPASSIQCT